MKAVLWQSCKYAEELRVRKFYLFWILLIDKFFFLARNASGYENFEPIVARGGVVHGLQYVGSAEDEKRYGFIKLVFTVTFRLHF